MEAPAEEFIKERMGEPLELRLRQNKNFRERQRCMGNIIQDWQEYFGGPQNSEMWEQLDQLQDVIAEYSSLYGVESYKMGYCDGIQIGAEKMPEGSKSLLSVTDMAHLIYMYDAVKKMNKVMLGEMLPDLRKDSGVFGALERVYVVIEHNVSSKIKLLGEDEAYEVMTGILDNRLETPEVRAKQLLAR